jgi:hypothetical protein
MPTTASMAITVPTIIESLSGPSATLDGPDSDHASDSGCLFALVFEALLRLSHSFILFDNATF